MKIIKVTAAADNTTMFINIDKIEGNRIISTYVPISVSRLCDIRHIFANDYEGIKGETVIETSNSSYCCTETTEEVYQKIKEAEND